MSDKLMIRSGRNPLLMVVPNKRKARRNPDDAPAGLPKWTVGLTRMTGPGDVVVWVDWKNPRWGTLVAARGMPTRAKFYPVYRMTKDGHRQLLRRVLRDELMSSYIMPNRGQRRTGARACDQCRVRLSPDDTCPKCGVWHGDPCPGCGRRGYHSRSCRLYPHTVQRHGPGRNPSAKWHKRMELAERARAKLADKQGLLGQGRDHRSHARAHAASLAASVSRRLRKATYAKAAEDIERAGWSGIMPNPGTDMGSIARTADFQKGLKLYRQIHGCDPKSIKRTILRLGPGDNQVTGRVVLVGMGKAPADSYEPPKGSRKEGRIWVHPYDNKPEKVVTVDGKTIITMPGTHAVKAGPDGEAWIHG